MEKLATPCLKKDQDAGLPKGPAKVVYPPGLTLPARDKVEVAAVNDEDFGFLRITLDGNKRKLKGEFFKAFTLSPSPQEKPALDDSFTLDLRTHKVR